MNLNLQSSDFALFGLPEQFAQEASAIDQRWKDLQREAHPDRFAAEGAAAQRLAMQWSVRINEAYRRLKDPLRRAAYLCELRGQAIDAERNTAMPAGFLVEQMEWREALDDAGQNAAALDALARRVRTAQRDALQRIAALLDDAGDTGGAAQQVRGLMFIDRFAQDVEKQLDRLEE